MLKGYIHSFESFGTVDGPGIRFVIFMQGCPLRCLYCHNPDTWKVGEGRYQLSADELLDEVLKYKNFIKKGGVTVTGGEPLLQAPFLIEFLGLCQSNGIHTAIDSSGCIVNDATKKLFTMCDLVLLDIKSIDEKKCKDISGASLERVLQTLDYLESIGKKVWIRHVIVPSLTDNEEELIALAQKIATYSCVEKIELLPYHTMGVYKYKEQGLEYELLDIEPLSNESLKRAREIFLNVMKDSAVRVM